MNNCRTNLTSIERAIHKANLRGDHENRKGITLPVFCFFMGLLMGNGRCNQ
jgi:hypothetical protein